MRCLPTPCHIPFPVYPHRLPDTGLRNHEDSPASLAHFTERFNNMPSNTGTVVSLNGEAPNNWYYSWDAGLVHYIALSTEAWFNPLQMGRLPAQHKWLMEDLAKANQNRDKVPWIIAHGHRSVYCSCDKDCDGAAKTIREGKYGLEEVFMKYGVDFCTATFTSTLFLGPSKSPPKTESLHHGAHRRVLCSRWCLGLPRC